MWSQTMATLHRGAELELWGYAISMIRKVSLM